VIKFSAATAALGAAALLLSSPLLAQARIVDISQPAAPVAVPSGEQYYQLQVLQEEVRQLRGLVEELSYTLNKVRLQQEDDYLNLDRRLAALQSDAAPSLAAAEGDTVQPQLLDADQLAVIDADYGAATDLLLKQRDIDAAASAYQAHIDNYANSPYLANAWYWLGEIALLRGQQQAAENAFGTILKRYGDHAKALDAKFKLAKIYAESGDRALAEKLFKELANGDSGTAIKARAYLRDNF
jgi:TolA-binding protein